MKRKVPGLPGPVVRTYAPLQGAESDLDQGTRILYAPQCGQKHQATPPKTPQIPQMWLCPCYFPPSLSQEEQADPQETAELQ